MISHNKEKINRITLSIHLFEVAKDLIYLFNKYHLKLYLRISRSSM